MLYTRHIIAALLSVGVTAGSAYAQQGLGVAPYVGLTYGTASPEDGNSTDMTGVIFGARSQGHPVSYGGEIEYSFGSGGDAGDTARLRGIVRNDLGDFGLFGTMGVTHMETDTSSSSGVNYGLGADYEFNDSSAIRLEMIQDDLSDAQDATTLRLGVTFSF